MSESPPKPQPSTLTQRLHSVPVQALLLSGMWIVLALLVIPLWGLTYWDFGDGNYLYVGQRINDGLVPYRDILAPQPPLHLLMSALVQRIGGWFGSELIGARVYSLVIRMLASLMVYLAAMKLFHCMARATIAAGLFLILPIGFWWSLCLQSENLEIVFLLLAFWGILRLDRAGVLIAGVGSALAMHCNMTAVPYFLCNALFLITRRPRLALYYLPMTLGIWGIGAGLAYAWAGPAYLDNVVLNQVGSFPREDLLGYSPLIYFRDKVVNEGLKVLQLEGPFILAGALAMWFGWSERLRDQDRRSDEYRRWEYGAWYSIGMVLSIGFVMKGGTVNYIFMLGEPAVALFAADALVRLRRTIADRAMETDIRVFAAIGLVALVGYWPAWKNVYYTLSKQQVELGEARVRDLMGLIETYSEPGDSIVAPPFYAYVTDRRVAAELAENYLWNIKYWNNRADDEHGEGVLKMEELARMLRQRQVPIVLLDMKQTGGVPEVSRAIEAAYQPLESRLFHSRNAPLGLYVPRGTPLVHESIFEEEEK